MGGGGDVRIKTLEYVRFLMWIRKNGERPQVIRSLIWRTTTTTTTKSVYRPLVIFRVFDTDQAKWIRS